MFKNQSYLEYGDIFRKFERNKFVKSVIFEIYREAIYTEKKWQK